LAEYVVIALIGYVNIAIRACMQESK